MAGLHLYLGNLNYSSWSLRAWLVMKHSGLPFEETFLELLSDDYRARIGDISPTGHVPVLHAHGAMITDSLAIAEWAAEQVPRLWPKDSNLRAEARSIAAQMHAGYLMIRRDLPMNLRRDAPLPDLSAGTREEISKVEALWVRALEASGGPFLYGDWSIADAFYAPVASRFRSYHIDLTPMAQAYADALLADTNFQQWETAAKDEAWILPAFEDETPGVLGWLKTD